MSVLAQYNPLTLKAIYSATAKKAQLAIAWENPLIPSPPSPPHCEYCETGKTPKYVSVKFHGMQQCLNCMPYYNPEYGIKFLVNVSSIVNKWWVLENAGFFYEGYYCQWVPPYQEGEAYLHAFTGSFGTKQVYEYASCSGDMEECSFNRLQMILTRGPSSLMLASNWVFNDEHGGGCSATIFRLDDIGDYCDVSGCATCVSCQCSEQEEECEYMQVQPSSGIWAEIREGRPKSV